jgi:uncharacterized membrane protein YphA (DoxX/SURF4 family)
MVGADSRVHCRLRCRHWVPRTVGALGLLIVILVAIATSGLQRIKVYKPIDEADRIDDWLYLPEVLYAFMLIIVVSAGAGPYSLDALILGLIDKRGA